MATGSRGSPAAQGRRGIGSAVAAGGGAVATARFRASGASVGTVGAWSRLIGASDTLVDRGQPVAILWPPAAHRLEVAILDGSRDRPDRAGAHRPVVDFDHRADLDAGAAQQDLVGHVQLGAVDRAGFRLEPLVLRKLHDRLAGDPFEDVVIDR